MVGDTELAQMRRLYYGLLVQLLWREPAVETVDALRADIRERASGASHLHPKLGEGWGVIADYLDANDATQVAEEFTTVFLGPFAAEVVAYESQYLAGTLFMEPLADVREFLIKSGLEKKPDDFAEPEDVLAFELSVMEWLIGQQMEAETEDDENRWLDLQAEFLKKHLLVWGPQCAQDMQTAQSAKFYWGVGLLLQGLLDLENNWFQGFGPDKVETIEEARRRYGKRKTFKGPVFDADAIKERTSNKEN